MRLALIGTGLIGGSAAWAMKNAGFFHRVTACDRNIESARKAVQIGFADRACDDISQAVIDADAVMVAVPVQAMQSVFAQIAKYDNGRYLITDVGSTRTTVIAAARRELGKGFARYAPMHPIAGGEMPGVEYAAPDLFVGCKVISTPEVGMSEQTRDFWSQAWQRVGAHIVTMTPTEHDEVFACVSHLPHVLAYTLINSIGEMPDAKQKFSFAGAGFRDFTRIAASSPAMWRDICLANKQAILDGLTAFEASLERMRCVIEKGDAEALEALFERASSERRRLFQRSPSNRQSNGGDRAK